MPVVSPAYGRDYKSANDAKEDWDNGKDFVSQGVMERGRYCSTRDFPVGTIVEIRYKKMTQLVVVRNKKS